ACGYSGMSAPSNHKSPSLTRAYDSSSDSLPSRSDFTSLPASMMPHSSVSRISYSCRALRFSLTVFGSRNFFPVATGFAGLEEVGMGLGLAMQTSVAERGAEVKWDSSHHAAHQCAEF